MTLKTTKTLPPGGWIFDQLKPDGSKKHFEFMTPFSDAVRQIADYRKGNGIAPFDADSVADELEAQTCQRLGGDPQWCVTEKKTSLLDRIKVLPAHVRSRVQLAGNVARGALILADWVGEDAKPVEVKIAQARADVCIGCPQNQASHGVMRLTDAIAEAIMEQRRTKLEMGLKVQGEELLHTCAQCSCHLPLKVWVPMKTILGRTSEKLVAEFPDHCWMKTENQSKETSCQDGLAPKPLESSPSISETSIASDSNSPAVNSAPKDVSSPSSNPSAPPNAPSLKSAGSLKNKSKPSSKKIAEAVNP